jgi:hypothetical protein
MSGFVLNSVESELTCVLKAFGWHRRLRQVNGTTLKVLLQRRAFLWGRELVTGQLLIELLFRGLARRGRRVNAVVRVAHGRYVRVELTCNELVGREREQDLESHPL